MATRKLIRAIQKLPRRTRKLSARLTKGFFTWLLRSLYTVWRRPTTSTAGFVLPTTVLLLLMVALTAGALTYRSFSRSEQAIAKRQQQVITNSATPAIDRAKAKLEYLFNEDIRYPGGTPGSGILLSMMLDDGGNSVLELDNGGNPYTLPDETQLDINNDTEPDLAWAFNADINADGTIANDEVIIYSILMGHEGEDPAAAGSTIEIEDPVSYAKARALVTRNGPIDTTGAGQNCPGSTRSPGQGWEQVNDSLQKNFQVNALVLNQNDVNRTVETLEFQQARQTDQANRWGAWFRYDLEAFPSADFNWNGAMHTEGSFLIRDKFNGHLVSAKASCVYDESEMTSGLHEAADNGGTEFRGQLIAGQIGNNDYGGGADAQIHAYRGTDDPRIDTLGTSKDSIVGTPPTAPPSQIATNPISLFTKGVYEHNSTTGWTEDDNALTNFVGRYRPEPSNALLDDYYRADNRWGPVTSYNDVGVSIDIPVADPPNLANTEMGKNITGNTQLTDETTGLDGYWERRAIATGLRLIVGQRLELGNAFGWLGNNDPLYPASEYGSNINSTPPSSSFNPGPHESLQYSTLRDNLAAVQGMVVYHYQGGGAATDGTSPAACYALTAHPGTRYTIGNSRTFDNYTIDPDADPSTASPLKVDFLSGQGTNGWEFNFASVPTPLGTALTNLATMTGDIDGGAPSFAAVQDSDVHPDPDLTIWGDFSTLKNLLADTGHSAASPGNGSPADKTTWESAACTLGLLAYNIDTLNDLTTAVLAAPTSSAVSSFPLSSLADAITAAVSTSASVINTNVTPASSWTGTSYTLTPDILANYTMEQWFNQVDGQNVNGNATDGPLAATFAANSGAEELFVMMSQKFQVDRDRRFGFNTGVSFTGDVGTSGNYDPATMDYTIASDLSGTNYALAAGSTVKASCDPDTFSGLSSEVQRISLAIALCPPVTNNDSGSPTFTPYETASVAYGFDIPTVVRYPALYYIFPTSNHDTDGGASDAQPGDEPYVSDNPGLDFTQVTDANINTIAAAFQPKDVSLWLLPNPVDLGTGDLVLSETVLVDPADVTLTSAGDNSTALFNEPATNNPGAYYTYDPEAEDITIAHNGRVYSVAMVDKGMFDGRENMSLRVLDLDLSLLTTDKNSTASADQDFWVSAVGDGAQGIVYAFREDAVREDELVRPTSTTWTSCDEVTEIIATTCPTNADPQDLRDPPLNDETGISAKPVDFFPDPMRRPYGFRLKNGEDLSAPDAMGSPQRDSGISFITDNSVYIQGDFNLHETFTAPVSRIEEFSQLVATSGYGLPFYTSRVDLNEDDFAALTNDRWRPAEILADAINILSANFRDGSIEDTFRMPSVLERDSAARGNGKSSYMAQNRPFFLRSGASGQTKSAGFFNDEWLRENPLDNRGYISHGGASTSFTHLPLNSPVTVPADGDYWDSNVSSDAVTGSRISYYRTVNDHGSNNIKNQRYSNLIEARDTRVNAVMISGIVPSREGQSYGGLHNFPRLLEHWGGDDDNKKELNISGAFYQFNFSTAATGLYDHEAWEPGVPTDNDKELNLNYTAPDRLWGYDVGLLYVPPAPISSRFVSQGTPRNEYYRELPIDDEYIMMLRCATHNGNRIDPTAEGECSANNL